MRALLHVLEFCIGNVGLLFKVAPSKATQAVCRALRQSRAFVGVTCSSRLPASPRSVLPADGPRRASCLSRFPVIRSTTHHSGNSAEMPLQKLTPTIQPRGLNALPARSHTRSALLSIGFAKQRQLVVEQDYFLANKLFLLFVPSKTVRQAYCSFKSGLSPLRPVSSSKVLSRSETVIGVAAAKYLKRSVNCFSAFKILSWRFSCPFYGASDHNRIIRSVHTETVLQQPSSSFHQEQQEKSCSAEGTGLEIAKLPISSILVDSLAKRGITMLLPIQRAVLEPGLKGLDLITCTKTGIGKTLAFGIPILNLVLQENEKSNRHHGRHPMAVVMAPTRELAKQVEMELKDTAPTVEFVCVYGGVPIDGHIRQLQRGVDVAVGTPGCFMDLLERGALNLREVKYIVLDEADRMSAVGFVEAVQKIFELLPTIRQCMLFSATMPSWVQDLARRYLRNPLIVDLVGKTEDKIAEGIRLLSLVTPMNGKLSILGDLIKVYGKGCKSIVFTQTKRDADDVAMILSKTIYCGALHGDITQFQRERTLKAFRDGKISVLITTDVAARGLDIPNVDLVVHYEITNESATFVHRSGQTGRAGKEGTAILMHTPYQMRTLAMLERELQCRFKSIEPPSFIDVIRSSSEQASDKVRSVHPDVRNVFLPTAEKLLSEEGIGAFAAAIANLCGYNEEMAFRSQLTYGRGLRTLKITRPEGQPILCASDVMRTLSQLLPSAANRLGKICMLSDEAGAVFDLPVITAKELLSMKISSGEVIEALEMLPNNLQEPLGNERIGGRPFFKREPPSGQLGDSSGERPGVSSSWSSGDGNLFDQASHANDAVNRSFSGNWSSWQSSGDKSGSWGNRPPSTPGANASKYGSSDLIKKPSATLFGDSFEHGNTR